MAYTSDDLLAIIKKRAFIPVSQETLDDQDLLDMATDEMYSQVVPEVLATREEWYTTLTTQAVDLSNPQIDIPSRAIAGALREVTYSLGTDDERNIPRLDIEDRSYLNNTGSLQGFIVQGNQLHLVGAEAGYVNLYFHARPGRLVPAASAARLTLAADLTNNNLTVDAVPSTWTTGTVIDVIKSTPHFEYRQLSLTIAGIAGNVITTVEDLSSKIAVNDWVSLEDTSPAPQIPLEWFQFLAEAVVNQVLLSQGDSESADRSEKKMERLKKSALMLMTPRIEGEAKRTVPPKNRGSYLWGRWS